MDGDEWEILMYELIQELTYAGVQKKQASVTKLFPPFKDRVKAVIANGSLELKNKRPGQWDFEIASGTKAGKTYDAVIRFKNLPEMIAKYAKDMRLWKKDNSGVDYRLLGRDVLNNVDVEALCSCPAFQYWGPAYIMTQKKAKYTEPENRPPNIRNPKQYGAVCKHYQVLLDVLPMWVGDMASYLKEFYGKEVRQAETDAKKEKGIYKAVAKDLRKREAPPEAPEAGIKEPDREEEPEKGIKEPEEEEGMSPKVKKDIEDLTRQIQAEKDPTKQKALRTRLQKYFEV